MKFLNSANHFNMLEVFDEYNASLMTGIFYGGTAIFYSDLAEI